MCKIYIYIYIYIFKYIYTCFKLICIYMNAHVYAYKNLQNILHILI